MKTIGLIGGMTWESSLEYYRIINEQVGKRLGGLHSAKCMMCSLDLHDVLELQEQGKWAELAPIIKDAAVTLENGGADLILICTNTIHKFYDEIQTNVNVPVLHIADAAGEVIKRKGLKKIGLLGTRFTMQEDFYKVRLKEKYDIDTVIPDEVDRQSIHKIIFDELAYSNIVKESKDKLTLIIKDLVSKGAEGIILGCTELPMIIKQEDIVIPVFDTLKIHAEAAVEEALE